MSKTFKKRDAQIASNIKIKCSTSQITRKMKVKIICT